MTLAQSTPVRSPTQVAGLGTVLGVWAHPDDEAYLSGGLMALARDAGSRVVCVTASRGELGTADPQAWPPARLAAAREGELSRSLAILGVTEHHWLEYPDGGCAGADPEPAITTLAALIVAVRPRTIITFGPDGMTGHQDHRAVSAWTTAAFRSAAPAGARLLHTAVSDAWWERWGNLEGTLGTFEQGYPLPVPAERLAVDLALDDQTLARKVAALRAQATQTDAIVAMLGTETYAEWVREESFVDATAARGS